MLGPRIRQLHSPVTPDQLSPLDAGCEVVQWFESLTDSELRQVARFMEQYPHVTIRRYGYDSLPNLRFLECFPYARKIQVDVFELQSFDGLESLNADLESLSLGQTRSKAHSLRVLQRFSKLRELYLESHTKHIEVLSELPELERLMLRSITLPNVSILLPLRKLWSLDLKLGGTTNLSMLPEVGRLQYIELWMIKGLADLSPIAEVSSLEYLFLQALKNVTSLPPMGRLPRLRRVHLETMKGVRDLSPLCEAQSLDTVLVLDARHMRPKDFACLEQHPALKHAAIGLGSDRKNSAVSEMLMAAGIASVPPDHPFKFTERAAA
jgi:hypothetical protein